MMAEKFPKSSSRPPRGAVSRELRYRGKHTIRTVKADGTLWFAARDLVDALGYTEEAYKVAAESPDIPACCRSIGLELPDADIPGEPDRAVLLGRSRRVGPGLDGFLVHLRHDGPLPGDPRL